MIFSLSEREKENHKCVATCHVFLRYISDEANIYEVDDFFTVLTCCITIVWFIPITPPPITPLPLPNLQSLAFYGKIFPNGNNISQERERHLA